MVVANTLAAVYWVCAVRDTQMENLILESIGEINACGELRKKKRTIQQPDLTHGRVKISCRSVHRVPV